jgi:hypothetical protein
MASDRVTSKATELPAALEGTVPGGAAPGEAWLVEAFADGVAPGEVYRFEALAEKAALGGRAGPRLCRTGHLGFRRDNARSFMPKRDASH